ncbi:hypothetical protein ACJIZ3_018764 [Penstemon smallii]|uniref:Uncharacterized protein n=1 Tax=Penstemon smallii TaxID=265156 RepID=A0ABD3SZC0_9LAMI
MKKSKFLQSSKDMLSRSFNPAKCKTSLRLAASRMKLLRNKKDVQVKQMKREIAQLLESGQDRTARIRVEHVIREEKMMAAYDLIEIYCELIIARLSIIETQKNCPIDLKEAIASVVFASPRCGDVPELLDVRKNFTAKYGKDFTTAAIELRPACGVSRMLVEKLSAVAPDGQAKTKILSAIAEEHNVKWEPNSFEEKDSVPPNDLLSGPSTFGNDSKVSVESSHFESPAVVQAPPSNYRMHSSPVNLSQQDHRTSLGTENLAPAQTSGASTTFQPEERPPALYDERSQLYKEDSNTDRQRWNMEFKDATSAAQAAAESAERASMAARAAAELASRDRIMRQYSTESHKSDVQVLKDDKPESYTNSRFNSEQFSEERVDRSPSERTRLQNEQIDSIKANNQKTAETFKEYGRGGKEYGQSASLKSKASIDDDLLDHDVPVVDGYSRRNSLKGDSRGDMRLKKQSFKYEAEKYENMREERKGKQPSVNSSRSHSSISNDANIFSNSKDQKFDYDASEDTFVGIGKANIHREASQKSYHESSPVFSDKSDSDSDGHEFDIGPVYDEPESEFHLASPSQKSPEHLSINTDSTSSLFFTRKNSSPEFSENRRNSSELDNFMPVAFDDSERPSESDEDISMSKQTGIKDSRDLLSKHEKGGESVSLQSSDERIGFNRIYLSIPSDDELKSEEMHMKKNKRNSFDDDSTERLSQPASGYKKSQIEANDSDDEPSHHRGEGLNFGKLTGGLRHKGYNHPPYLKNKSSLKEKTQETPPAVESPKISTKSDHKKSSRTPELDSDSDSDSSDEEEYIPKKSNKKHELFARPARKEVRPKLSLGASKSIFGSDNSDLDDEVPKESPSSKNNMRNGISRRTKASPSGSGTSSYSKTRVSNEAIHSDSRMNRKPTTSETPKESESQRNSSPTSAKVASKPAKSNYWGPPEQPNSTNSQVKSESDDPYARRKSSQLENSEQRTSAKVASGPTKKSSQLEEPSSSESKKEASVSSESPKAAATNNKTTSNKDESTKKASHVHPKLPDYESLVQSLRMNRS